MLLSVHIGLEERLHRSWSALQALLIIPFVNILTKDFLTKKIF